MGNIRFGCQTYTWQMSYDKYSGKMPHILEVVKNSGFQGVEPEVCMLGSYRENPELLFAELKTKNLELAAIALALPWKYNEETQEEKNEALKVIEYLKHFPGTLLVLCQLPGDDRLNIRERQQNAITCINSVAAKADDNGIRSVFHPNSPLGSIFRIREDYEVLFNGLNSNVVGYAPDAGHIVNGGMKAHDIFSTYRSLIKHVHFKDINVDGEWTAMGKGVIDFPSIVEFLKKTQYNGWIMIEEESRQAEAEPDIVTISNGQYVRQRLKSILNSI